MGNIYGTGNVHWSRYATEEEIDRITVKIPFMGDCDVKYGGMPLRNDGKYLHVLTGEEHTGIVSSTGSGKTTRLLLWMLWSMSKATGKASPSAPSSLIIHDSKGECYSYMKSTFEKNGYQIKVLNLKDPGKGDCYNPLRYAAELYWQGEESKAIQLVGDVANCICKSIKSDRDSTWETGTKEFFIGLFRLLCEKADLEQITLENVFHLYLEGSQAPDGGSSSRADATNFLRYYKQFGEGDKPASWNGIQIVENTANETKRSFYGTFSTAISKYIANEALLDMLSGHDIDVHDFLNKKTALFVISSDSSSYYGDIGSLIVDQIYQRLIEIAEDEYGGELPKRIEFVLDEFPALYIPDCAVKFATARSRNIRFHIAIQSLQQLSSVYGVDDAMTIMSNIEHWFYLHSTDMELLKWFSERTGQIKARYTGEIRPLLSVNDLLHLKKEDGEVLFLSRGYPYMCYLPPYYEFEGRSEMSYIKDIPKRKKRDRKLFSIIDEIRSHELQETLKTRDVFFEQEKMEQMIQFGGRNPLTVAGYLLYDSKTDEVFCNRRRNEQLKGEMVATFQYGKKTCVVFQLMKEGSNETFVDAEFHLAFYNASFRISALKQIPEKTEKKIKTAFLNSLIHLHDS